MEYLGLLLELVGLVKANGNDVCEPVPISWTFVSFRLNYSMFPSKNSKSVGGKDWYSTTETWDDA